MDYYNYRRTHQGYKLNENGYKIPGQVHFQKNLTKTKECAKTEKIGEIISRKEGGKILNFAFYPVKLEVEKREVLAYQSVNTS